MRFTPFSGEEHIYGKHMVAENSLQFLMKHLDGYDAKYVYSPFNRVIESFHTQNQATYHIYKSSEREQFILFSKKPLVFVLPPGLCIKKSDRHKFQKYIVNDNEIDLEALCADGKLTIGCMSVRKYGKAFDDVVAKYKDQVFYIRHDLDESMFNILLHSRVDAIGAYGIEVKYAKLENELEILRISGMPQCLPSHIGITKNPWGQALMEKIDAIMEDSSIMQKFKNDYVYWLDDAEKAQYEKAESNYYSLYPLNKSDKK